MSSRDVFSPNELAELRGFPEISREELIRYFTLTPAEVTFVGAKRSPTTASLICSPRGDAPSCWRSMPRSV